MRSGHTKKKQSHSQKKVIERATNKKKKKKKTRGEFGILFWRLIVNLSGINSIDCIHVHCRSNMVSKTSY